MWAWLAPDSEEERSSEEKVLSFTEHLEELRWRIIHTLLFFVLSFTLSFFVAPLVISVLIQPLLRVETSRPENILSLVVRDDGVLAFDSLGGQTSQTSLPLSRLQSIDALQLRLRTGEIIVPLRSKNQSSLFFLSPADPFWLLIKGALLLSIFLTIPMALYQTWRFVEPGLLAAERRIVRPILVASVFLFLLGVFFAYLMSHVMLRFLLGLSAYIPDLQPNIVASDYLGFMLTLMLGFGLVFEFPLVLILLARLGVISSQMLAARRKYAILVIAVAAAAVTPTPDAFSMIMMMLPLVVLYELSIWIIRLIEPRRIPRY